MTPSLISPRPPWRAVVLVIALAGFTLGQAGAALLQVRTAAAVAESRRDEAIAGCRAALRVDLIDAPTFRALEAFAADDPEALDEALAVGDPDEYDRLVGLFHLGPRGLPPRVRPPGPLASRP